MRYLLDTNVFAEYSKLNPQQKVIDWIDSQSPESLYISAVTIGEIEKGIVRMAPSKRKAGLEKLLERLILRFDIRILVLDTATFRLWGKLVGRLENKGRTLPVLDSLLAATALEHDLTIVTRNDADFKPTGAKVLNIWQT